jgi:hypothetical protein
VHATGTVSRQEVGFMQVEEPGTIYEAMRAFRLRVASLGGSQGIVDVISCEFNMRTGEHFYTYNCGTPASRILCTGTSQVNEEVMTVRLTVEHSADEEPMLIIGRRIVLSSLFLGALTSCASPSYQLITGQPHPATTGEVLVVFDADPVPEPFEEVLSSYKHRSPTRASVP